MPSDLLEQLKDADQLPTAPGVALRIVELNRQEDVDIDVLSNLIGQDPVLAARVIRAANSGMFGMPREVTSLRQAVLVLGLRTVNLLALSFSVISTSTGRACARFSYPVFWTHTACMAMGMRLIAARQDRSLCDEAFLAGLLSRFGQLVLAECAADQYNLVLEHKDAQGCSLRAAELEVLGTTHARFAGELLERWGLPEPICRAITYTEALEGDDLDLDGSNADAGPGVRSALRLAKIAAFTNRCGAILTGQATDAEVTELIEHGEQWLGFDRAQCNEVLTRIQESLASLAETLGLDIQDDASVLAIRQRATELLLRESLALQRQVQSVSQEMGQLEKQKRALEERATTDGLTGLRNRGYFDESLRAGMREFARGKHPLGLLLIDLDHFKSVNDEHGHAVGDAMLCAAAEAITVASGEGAVCCRYGGEEFAVIVREGTAESLAACAERIRESISARKIELSESVLSRTASIGGCFLRVGMPPPSLTALVEAADRALYDVKHAGRNACEIREL